MCGITGYFGYTDAKEKVAQALTNMAHRGRDATGVFEGEKFALGHTLHSIVSTVPQPIKHTGVLVANCEIYNWKELCKKYSITARNDADLLCQLLDAQSLEVVLSELDGVYAFAFFKDNVLTLARDIIGEKPIHYILSESSFAFASEKHILGHDALELNPRRILTYNIQTQKLLETPRAFFTLPPETTQTHAEIVDELEKEITTAIQKRIPDSKLGILFSGGIDSTVIAVILQKLKVPFHCYVTGVEGVNEADDVTWAKKVAEHYHFPLTIVAPTLDETESELKELISIIGSSNVIKVGVALPFYFACKQAAKDGVRVLFSGLGSEELFAGYQRHMHAANVNAECISGLLKLYERDLYRDDAVTMHHTIELRVPFLDIDLIKYSLTIPQKFKIIGATKKIVLRDVAKRLGIPNDVSDRPKKAAQYGSAFHKALEKLTKRGGFKLRSAYLDQFYPWKNEKLGILYSSGKDSNYALYVMQRQNYPISCLLTMQSQNLDSYMFHTPTIEMAKLQSDALQIPILTQETTGEKEAELLDMKTLLERAKKEFEIDGIVTGALFSTYQRERIEKVADQVGLKIFSPLWHIPQDLELRQVIQHGFAVILTKVAAEGLDSSWLNRVLTIADVERLIALKTKLGVNVAGEGGEYESLVIDGPNFTQRLVIEDFEITQDGIVATMHIKKASLLPKQSNQE